MYLERELEFPPLFCLTIYHLRLHHGDITSRMTGLPVVLHMHLPVTDSFIEMILLVADINTT